MANNTYSFTDLKKAVTHALAGNPDQNITTDEIVNGALSWLGSMAPWRWKQKALNIAQVNAQTFVNLPADFEELMVLRKVGDTTGMVESVTLDRIIEARQAGGTVASGLWYCLDWTPQSGPTVEPTPILQLYPTPGATPPALIGTYLRQIPKLVNATDLPDIPSAWHELLKIMCRAYAVSQEGQSRGADWQLMLDMLPRYEALDGRSPGYLGKYRGGIRPASASNLASQTQTIGA